MDKNNNINNNSNSGYENKNMPKRVGHPRRSAYSPVLFSFTKNKTEIYTAKSFANSVNTDPTFTDIVTDYVLDKVATSKHKIIVATTKKKYLKTIDSLQKQNILPTARFGNSVNIGLSVVHFQHFADVQMSLGVTEVLVDARNVSSVPVGSWEWGLVLSEKSGNIKIKKGIMMPNVQEEGELLKMFGYVK